VTGTFGNAPEGTQVGTYNGTPVFISYLSNGGAQVALYGSNFANPVYAGTATAAQNAYFIGNRQAGSTAGTFNYANFEIEPGSTWGLGSGESLSLGTGNAYIDQGATMPASGTISAAGVTNNGLLTVPITNQPAALPVATLATTAALTQSSSGILRMYIAGNQQGSTYSLINTPQSVNLSGQLQIVLQPDAAGFVPTVGETFDLITAAGGINLNNLQILTLVTQSGAGSITSATEVPYASGYAGDTDQLFAINGNIFTAAVVDNGTTLEITDSAPLTPEPARGLIAVASALLLLRSRPRKLAVR
jgi:hypothetical protein